MRLRSGIFRPEEAAGGNRWESRDTTINLTRLGLDRQVRLVRQRAGEVRRCKLVGEEGHVANEVGAPLVEEGALKQTFVSDSPEGRKVGSNRT